MRNFHLACVQERRLCHCVYFLAMENNHAILENFKVQANVLMKVKAIQDTVCYVNLNVLYANLRKVCSNFKNKGSWRHLWGVPLWSSYYLVSTKGALPYSWGCWCCPSRNCSGKKNIWIFSLLDLWTTFSTRKPQSMNMNSSSFIITKYIKRNFFLRFALPTIQYLGCS